MTIQEFEDLTGKSVSDEEYGKIENAYMNASQEWDKARFCEAVRKAKPETLSLIYDLSQRINILEAQKQNANHSCEMLSEAKEQREAELKRTTSQAKKLAAENGYLQAQVNALATALIINGFVDLTRAIISHEQVIAIKCEQQLELSQADRQCIIENFKK